MQHRALSSRVRAWAMVDGSDDLAHMYFAQHVRGGEVGVRGGDADQRHDLQNAHRVRAREVELNAADADHGHDLLAALEQSLPGRLGLCQRDVD